MSGQALLSEGAQEAIYTVAYTSFMQGQYEDAISLLRTLTVANPRSQEFWLALGACFQATKEYQKAIDNYARVAMLNPSDPHIHLYAANCFFAQKRVKEGLLALSWSEKTLKEQPLEKRRSLKAYITLLRQAWKKDLSHG
jgi:type III secretion system low calcium response chaperone LcrH/SycD